MHKNNLLIEANRPDLWNSIIRSSHSQIFDPDYLLEMGNIYRREFAGEQFETHQTIPHIPASKCGFANAEQICQINSGFDLPLLFTPKEGWNGRCVGVASQDPLRGKGWDNALTMCTPWGFSSPTTASRGGKIIWPFVEWLCLQGYGVYMTDVWKLWDSSKPPIQATEGLIDVQKYAFSQEVEHLPSDLWLALGKTAEQSLSNFEVPRILGLPHPTARASHLKEAFNVVDAKYPTLRTAYIHKISEVLRLEA